ncbi:MAG: hypothetical protein AAGF12_29720 [Myxococcota bacterium]
MKSVHVRPTLTPREPRSRGALEVAGLALVLVAGCTDIATQVILHVDADPGIRERAQTITVRVLGEAGEEVASQSVVLRGPNAEASFPFVQPIYPRDGDTSRSFHLAFDVFEAGANEGGILLARERAIGRYSEGERRHGWLRFSDACADFLDCGTSETCIDGACAPACLEPTSDDAEPVAGRSAPVECAVSDAWTVRNWPSEWPCQPSQCLERGFRFRSIGTETAPVHTGFAASVDGTGIRVTVAAADLPEQIGTGDRIVFSPDTAAEESSFVLGRVSSTRLLLQTTVSRDLVDVPFRIERAYHTLQDWESDREGDLVEEGRAEVGVAYADAPFIGRVVFDGSITDPSHYFHLTVHPVERHRGRAGRGARLEHRFEIPTGTGVGEVVDEAVIDVRTAHTRIDWLEIRGWAANNQEPEKNDGYHAITVRANGVELSHLLVHTDGARRNLESATDAIWIQTVGGTTRVRDSMFYDLARSAIVLRNSRESRLEVDNVSVLECMRGAYTPTLGCIGVFGGSANELLIRNSVAHAHQRLGCAIETPNGFQRGAFFNASWTRDAPNALAVIDSRSGHNVSTDRSAFGEGSVHVVRPVPPPMEDPCRGGSRIDVEAGDPRDLFIEINEGAQDLHLREESPARGVGRNLATDDENGRSRREWRDIDAERRPLTGPWDAGADQSAR